VLKCRQQLAPSTPLSTMIFDSSPMTGHIKNMKI